MDWSQLAHDTSQRWALENMAMNLPLPYKGSEFLYQLRNCQLLKMKIVVQNSLAMANQSKYVR
jgi:hypothetical protein